MIPMRTPSEKLHVRPARMEDAPSLARCMLDASRGNRESGLWDALLPGPENDRLSVLTELCRGEMCAACSWRTFIVGEVAGRVVGSANGRRWLPGDVGMAMALLRLAYSLGWSHDRMVLMKSAAKPFAACSAWDIPEDTALIDWAATDEEWRGRGIADVLVDAVSDDARDKGFRRVAFSAFIGNRPIVRLGLRHGFRVVAELRDEAFERVTGASGTVLLVREFQSTAD